MSLRVEIRGFFQVQRGTCHGVEILNGTHFVCRVNGSLLNFQLHFYDL